jgi:hypothetical protein
MGTTISNSTSAILKILYDKSGIQDACYPAQSLLKAMKKVDAGGKQYNQVVRYNRIGGGGPSLSTAQTNSAPMKDAEFAITKSYYYLPWTISRELMLASKGGGEKAYVDGLKDAIADGLASAGCDLEQQIWGNGGGAIGQVATSGLSTTSCTLKNIEDVVHFNVGDRIYAATTDGTSGALETGNSTGYCTLAAVNRDTGVLTSTVAWTTAISSMADGDYLFRAGHFGKTLVGVGAWIPATAPTNSVDPILTAGFYSYRYYDATRLAGTRTSGSSMSVDDAILNCAQRMAREGVQGDITVWLSPNKYNSLAKSVRQNQYFMNNSKAEVGFEAIKFPTPAGVWSVVPATFCPDSYGYALDMNTWKLLDFGTGIPDIVQDDGNMLFRSASEDSFEVRIASYLQVCCSNPSRNGVITF